MLPRGFDEVNKLEGVTGSRTDDGRRNIGQALIDGGGQAVASGVGVRHQRYCCTQAFTNIDIANINEE